MLSSLASTSYWDLGMTHTVWVLKLTVKRAPEMATLFESQWLFFQSSHWLKQLESSYVGKLTKFWGVFQNFTNVWTIRFHKADKARRYHMTWLKSSLMTRKWPWTRQLEIEREREHQLSLETLKLKQKAYHARVQGKISRIWFATKTKKLAF